MDGSSFGREYTGDKRDVTVSVNTSSEVCNLRLGTVNMINCEYDKRVS